ncbi:MAG: tRNA (adenosine(37)-N6)-threonylcarbamoyltransferase complex ATPase subunit type 1 TsaE [Candidatus Caenarcaniphilales bacterium]|nr:tRNA (adenosine(37)-N6)-threonylcarbamoyltransferase complex ATPase subunit type 1 TsaE [Candidatus Caenarcaniphilales bacterium]
MSWKNVMARIKNTILITNQNELSQIALYLKAKIGSSRALMLLDGELGAGKTTFTKELYRAYGGDPALIQSPTYSHIHEYPFEEGLFVHIDLYREVIDLSELTSDPSVRLILVEWANQLMLTEWIQIAQHDRLFLCKIEIERYIQSNQRLFHVQFVA